MKLVGLKPVLILSLGLLLVQSSAWSMTIQIGAGGAELIKRGDPVAILPRHHSAEHSG